MTADFFDATLGDPHPGPAGHEVLWLRPSEARGRWFASHDRAYSPSAPARDRRAYRAALAARVFDRMGIPALRHFCTELGLPGFFDHVLSSADVGMPKPDRRIFLEACEHLGVPPERTLHVGDTYLDDYVGGRSAGLQVVLLDRAGDSGSRAGRAVRSLSEVLDTVVGPRRDPDGPSPPRPGGV